MTVLHPFVILIGRMPAAKLGKINLLPKDSFEFSTLGKILKWALTSGRVLVVLTEFVVILAFGSRFYFDRRLNDLIEVIVQEQAVVDSYADIEKRVRAVLAKQAIVEKYSKEGLVIDNVIKQIRMVTPQDVSFDEIAIDGKGFSLTGSAGSEGGLANLLLGVNTIPNIGGVNVGGIEFDQRRGVINFRVSVTMSRKT